MRNNYDKIGRNDQCRCESGKKYKHCCLLKDDKSIETQLYYKQLSVNNREIF